MSNSYTEWVYRLAKQSRRKGNLTAALYVLACLGCLISGSVAAMDFPAFGGSGNDFRDTCPAGQFLVGLSGRSGQWVDQISITCAPLDVNGSTAGTPFNGPTRGGNGGGPYAKTCLPGHIITGVTIMMTDQNEHVRLLIFNCQSTTTSSRNNLDVGNAPFFPENYQICPTGQAVNGIQGRSDAYVNAVGMICGAIPGATTTSQGPETPSACPSAKADTVPDEWSGMLNAHNERRKLHCVKPLTWSNELALAAQSYASKCKIGQHGVPSGENLADAWNESNGQPVLPAKTDVDAFEGWSCEEGNYDFSNPALTTGSTGADCKGVNAHFTQIVWRDTCQLGCGRATCTITDPATGIDHQGTQWVCRYKPPGNDSDPSVLKQQVLPPKDPCG